MLSSILSLVSYFQVPDVKELSDSQDETFLPEEVYNNWQWKDDPQIKLLERVYLLNLELLWKSNREWNSLAAFNLK